MENTKEKIMLIDDATTEAKNCLRMAYEIMSVLSRDYFDEADLKNLIYTARNYPDSITNLVNAVNHLLFEAIAELALFGNPENHQLQYEIRNYEEKKKILEVQKILDRFNKEEEEE